MELEFIMDNSAINDIAGLGLPVLTTLACNLVAEALKVATADRVNRFIPIILMVLAGAVYPLVASAADIQVNVASPRLYLVLVGVCLGGMAVALNQVVQQVFKKKEP